MSKVTRVWRIYEPYLIDSIYEIKADTHEEAMQKHRNGESEYITDGDGYEAPDGVDPEVELRDEYDEDND